MYQTHWWRCNGVCQTRRPRFGIVRRSSNRAPGPRDFWWEDHRRQCGGTFVKINEPSKKAKKSTKSTTKPNADITKYITTNNKTNNNNITKPVLKDSNSTTVKTKPKCSNTLVIPKKEPVFNPQCKKPPVLFEGKGHTVAGVERRINSSNVVEEVRNVWSKKQFDVTCTPDKKDQVAETVRRVWAKKQLPVALPETLPLDENVDVSKGKQLINKIINTPIKSPLYISVQTYHTANCIMKSPPAKMKKIDDYFKATSVLKDLYGSNFKITERTGDSQKLIAVSNESKTPATDTNVTDDKNAVDIIKSVNCPICNALVSSQEINRHLDECLNKGIIENICNETNQEFAGGEASISAGQSDKPFSLNEEKEAGNRPVIPVFQAKKELCNGIQDVKPEHTFHNIGDATSLDDVENEFQKPFIGVEPGASKGNVIITKCACCGQIIDKPLAQHLDECLAFFENNTTIPEEGASTSSVIETIVIDDDVFDESLTLNATGTKVPCPCCLEMVEEAEMNEHLDTCLS